MDSWQLQAAKQRFSELIRAVEVTGPQVVTRHGREVAVVVDVATYQRLARDSDGFREFLLAGPAFDDLEIERDSSPAHIVEVE